MENKLFTEICTRAQLDPDTFIDILKETGLQKVVANLPDQLFQLFGTHQELSNEFPDLEKITKTLLERINDRMRLLPNNEKKAQLKSDIQAFSYHTLQALKEKYPQIAEEEVKIQQALEKYDSKPNININDLKTHTSKFRKDTATSSAKNRKQKNAEETAYGFVQHLGSAFEKLNTSVCKDYGITKSIGHFRNIFTSKRKPIPPINIQDGKHPLFICFMHKLWKMQLITPRNGAFWNTLSGCIVDPEGKFSSEKLKKTHSRLCKKPGKKHAYLANEVDGLLKEIIEKRTKSWLLMDYLRSKFILALGESYLWNNKLRTRWH